MIYQTWAEAAEANEKLYGGEAKIVKYGSGYILEHDYDYEEAE
jgi:hypothetical protein